MVAQSPEPGARETGRESGFLKPKVSFQQYFSTKYFSHLWCVSVTKSKIGFLNLKESEKWILRFFTKQINQRSRIMVRQSKEP